MSEPTPFWEESDPILKALKEIASYNADELRGWEEENAADMVDIARAALEKAGERV
jgi:hypothetical protein